MSTLKPSPCWAVIFVSKRTAGDHGYGEAAQRMEELGSRQPGFLGIDSARSPDGRGITVAFYATEEAAHDWGRHPEHREVQRRGHAQWYESYEIYFSKVEHGRAWTRPND